jgi:secreted trypsin-like serine protease
MLNRLSLGVATACVISAVSPVSASEKAPTIVNGSDTSTSAYPSYARLYHNEYGNFGFCGGTFIDATHVLTAAHCVDIQDADIDEVDLLFTVVIPNLDDESDVSSAEKHYVSKFYVHENYDSSELTNDIAILKLETAVNVSAYGLITSDENDYRTNGASETFTAVGHGNTATGVDSTTVLQQAELDYIVNSACTYYTGGLAAAPDTQLCMSGDIIGSLRKGVCNGDSGGPLYWNNSSDYVVGIASYVPAIGCGNTAVVETSVFTEVADYSGWITNVTNGLVNATYTTSESDREYYRQNGSLPTVPSSSSGGGGGGSVPLWTSLLLLGAFLLRQKK